jgi:hypothetical protein
MCLSTSRTVRLSFLPSDRGDHTLRPSVFCYRFGRMLDPELDSALACQEKLPSSILAHYCPQAFALGEAFSLLHFFSNSMVTPQRLQISPSDTSLWRSPAASGLTQQWRQHRQAQPNACGQKNTEHEIQTANTPDQCHISRPGPFGMPMSDVRWKRLIQQHVT